LVGWGILIGQCQTVGQLQTVLDIDIVVGPTTILKPRVSQARHSWEGN
jgi:hypothetical protein